MKLPTEKLNPDVQHYSQFAIQPIDFIVANNLNFLEGNVIKYVARYKYKNGLDDLKKAKNYLDWLIEQETGDCEMKIDNDETTLLEIDAQKLRDWMSKHPIMVQRVDGRIVNINSNTEKDDSNE